MEVLHDPCITSCIGKGQMKEGPTTKKWLGRSDDSIRIVIITKKAWTVVRGLYITVWVHWPVWASHFHLPGYHVHLLQITNPPFLSHCYLLCFSFFILSIFCFLMPDNLTMKNIFEAKIDFVCWPDGGQHAWLISQMLDAITKLIKDHSIGPLRIHVKYFLFFFFIFVYMNQDSF